MTPKIQSWPMYQKSFFKRCIYKIGSNKVRNWQFKFRTETKLKVAQWAKNWNFSNNTATSSNLAQKVSEMTIYVPNWNQNFKVTNVPKNSFVRKTLYWQKNWNSVTSQLFWKICAQIRFRIDTKVSKLTNVQNDEISVIWQLFGQIKLNWVSELTILVQNWPKKFKFNQWTKILTF